MAQLSKITILKVDDYEFGRYALTRRLQQAGFAVMEAAMGEEAINLAAKNPNLIILDVNLPNNLKPSRENP